MIYLEPPKKVLPDKNSGYKNLNSSSMIYVEPPKKVLPDKNSGYKNVNSSSMIYVEPPKKEPLTIKSVYPYYNYCSIH